MKIYFVLYTSGYWHGLATTNERVAKAKLAEDFSYELAESELMPIDFVPEDMTWVSRWVSRNAEVTDLENYLCFNPAYQRNSKDCWMGTVRKNIIPLLESGIYCHSFDEGIHSAEALHIKRPQTTTNH